MNRARFLAEARREFLAEVSFYNAEQPGLGLRFSQAVENCVVRVLALSSRGFARSCSDTSDVSQRISFRCRVPAAGRRDGRSRRFSPHEDAWILAGESEVVEATGRLPRDQG